MWRLISVLGIFCQFTRRNWIQVENSFSEKASFYFNRHKTTDTGARRIHNLQAYVHKFIPQCNCQMFGIIQCEEDMSPVVPSNSINNETQALTYVTHCKGSSCLHPLMFRRSWLSREGHNQEKGSHREKAAPQHSRNISCLNYKTDYQYRISRLKPVLAIILEKNPAYVGQHQFQNAGIKWRATEWSRALSGANFSILKKKKKKKKRKKTKLRGLSPQTN
jgi:hypothetical protein